jgi:hypothetical protein
MQLTCLYTFDYAKKTEGLDMKALYVVMLYGVEIPFMPDGKPPTLQNLIINKIQEVITLFILQYKLPTSYVI